MAYYTKEQQVFFTTEMKGMNFKIIVCIKFN